MTDEQLVRQVEASYDRAWTASDLDGVLACFTKDAILVSPRGEVARGSTEIRSLLGTFMSGPAQGTSHAGRIIRISFVTPDVAVVDGEASIIPKTTPSKPLATHKFTDILRKEHGVWRIAHIRACPFIEEP